MYILSSHAQEEASRRGIPLEIIDTIMRSPQQIIDAHSERKVYQSQIYISGTLYLVRVIVELENPLKVVTVYRTTKIEKYWSDEA